MLLRAAENGEWLLMTGIFFGGDDSLEEISGRQLCECAKYRPTVLVKIVCSVLSEFQLNKQF